MTIITYYALLVADSRKWSTFGEGTIRYVAPEFYYEHIDPHIRITGYEYATLESEVRRNLFWNAPQGLRSDCLTLCEVLPLLERKSHLFTKPHHVNLHQETTS